MNVRRFIAVVAMLATTASASAQIISASGFRRYADYLDRQMDSSEPFHINQGIYDLFDEDFADLAAWSTTGTVTVSGGVCSLVDEDGSSEELLTDTALQAYAFPTERPFVVDYIASVPTGQKLALLLQYVTTTIAQCTIGESNNYVYFASQGTSGAQYAPTNFDQTEKTRVRILVNPVLGTIRFYIYYKDSATNEATMTEVGTAKTWTYTRASHPTKIKFSTGATATGTATVEDVTIYAPWAIIIGDSLAAGSPDYSIAPEVATPHYPANALGYWISAASGGDLPVVNQGQGGHSISNLAARYESMVLAYDPDWCILQIGTNDCDQTLATEQAEFLVILDAILAAGIKVCVMDIPPVNGFTAGQNAFKGDWNSWLEATVIPARANCVLAKTHDLMENPATPNTLYPPYTRDNTHPNAIANRIRGAKAWDAITRKTQ